jgi:hypothetical protein
MRLGESGSLKVEGFASALPFIVRAKKTDSLHVELELSEPLSVLYWGVDERAVQARFGPRFLKLPAFLPVATAIGDPARRTMSQVGPEAEIWDET